MSKVSAKRKTDAAAADVDDDEDKSGDNTHPEETDKVEKKPETAEQRERRERKNARARERRAEKAAAKKAMAEISATAAEPAEVKAGKAAEKQKKKEVMAEGDKLCAPVTVDEVMGAGYTAEKVAKAVAKAAEKHPQFGVGSTWFDQSVLDAGLLCCNALLDNAKKAVEQSRDASVVDVLFNFTERLKAYVTGSASMRGYLSRTFSCGHFTCDDIERLCILLMRQFAGDKRIIDLGLSKGESIGFVSGVLLQPTLVAMMIHRASCCAEDALLFLEQEVRDEEVMKRFEAESNQRLAKRSRKK
jgi:hypothetical protein